MRKRAGWLFAGAILISAVALTALWIYFRPRPAVSHTLKLVDRARRLQKFTSAPLDSAGTRLRLFIPEGWKVETIRPDLKNAASLPRVRHAYVYATVRRPPPPGFLERLFSRSQIPPNASPWGYIQAVFMPVPRHKKLRPTGRERLKRDGRTFISYREWVSADGKAVFTLRYHSEDYSAFKRTHDLISHGFRLK